MVDSVVSVNQANAFEQAADRGSFDTAATPSRGVSRLCATQYARFTGQTLFERPPAGQVAVSGRRFAPTTVLGAHLQVAVLTVRHRQR